MSYSNGIYHTGLLIANLYDIYHCCVYSENTPDDGQRNCPKHVEFQYDIYHCRIYCKNLLMMDRGTVRNV